MNDLDDDFSAFPARGGQSLIFMVGCGHVDRTGDWVFRIFTADRLDEAHELNVLTEWIEYMKGVCEDYGCSLPESRLFHWHSAERQFLVTQYNSAANRHGLPTWNDLPWVDLLNDVVKQEPVVIKGAFGFGLKGVARAMRGHGFIDTTWEAGSVDGQGAMVGAWWCDAEASRLKCGMTELEMMREIGAYNEIDCKVMMEILGHFRRHM